MPYIHHYKIFITLFLLLYQNVYSQDEKSQWVVGAGINFVDIRHSLDVGETVQDYFDLEDSNIFGNYFKFSVGKYLDEGLSLQVSPSFNTIAKGWYYPTTGRTIKESFFAIDAKIKYNILYNYYDTGIFDPFILVGLGYSKIGEKSNSNVGAGYGFNVWINTHLGLSFQSDYNHFFEGTQTDYFQHSIGFIYRFGDRGSYGWNNR
ncbi:MAG: outer membrane beta-barrel protein [Flavobacteriaceae bacterium]|nr:outer membrane beta-barrel protein [Flavobacteriaceae bacterium]